MEFELPGGEGKAGVCMDGEEGGQGCEARKVLRELGAQMQAPKALEGAERIVH